MPIAIDRIMRTLTDFGLSGELTKSTSHTNYLDDVIRDSPQLDDIAHEIEKRIREIYRTYGVLIKEQFQRMSPRFEGDFSRSYMFRTYPNKGPKVSDNVSLHIGIKKSSMIQNEGYFNRILYGDESRVFSPATPKFIRWALSKKMIYLDRDGVYRKIQYSTTKKYRGRRIRGKKFEGLLTQHPGILENLLEISALYKDDIEESIQRHVVRVLKDSGIT